MVPDDGEVDDAEVDLDEGWVDDDTPPQELEFTGTPGMTCNMPTTVLGFVQLFLTRELLLYLTEETNKYAIYCRDVLKQGPARHWQGCNVTDMAQYLGLTMLMGVHRLPAIKLYWSTTRVFVSSIFSQIMTYRRFMQLGRYIHAFNKQAVPPNNRDHLVLVRPVMEYLQERC